jgi:predicted Rossmann fold flavoprotein
MQLYDTIIVGGGAAGLTAAVFLGRFSQKQNTPFRIAILEKQGRVGKKLLSTGNGTCNISNENATLSRYHGDVELAETVLSRFSPAHTVSFFESIGVSCVKREKGKYYPRAEQAAAVLTQLRLELDALGVEQICETVVNRLEKKKDHIAVFTDNSVFSAKTVLVATGGAAAPQLGGDVSGYGLFTDLGHHKTPLFPSIVQLRTDPQLVKAMKGMRVTATVTLEANGEARQDLDEVLFTDYGVSGPAVMQVSRVAADWERQKKGNCILSIDLFPDMDADKLFTLLQQRRQLKNRTLEEYLTGLLNKRVGQTALKAAGFSLSQSVDTLTDADLKKLTKLLKKWEFPIIGTKGFSGAQVTAGGLDGKEFDQWLQSRKVSGVFAAGELLNVDGDCGGFNLQFAFASAFTAANGIVKQLGGKV